MYKTPITIKPISADDILTQDDYNYSKIVKTKYSIYTHDIKVLILSSIPTSICFLLELLPSFINIYFIGQLADPKLLGAVGLAIMWINCSGSAILYGISVGLETLAAQAFGAKNYNLMCLYYQKALVIIILMLIPITFALINTSSILELLGASVEIADLAEEYAIILIPSVILSGLYDATKCYLHAQNVFSLQMYVGLLVTGLHIGWCILYSRIFDWGMKGIAFAKVTSDIIQILALLFLIYYKKVLENTWRSWSKEAFEGWINFLKVAIPVGLIIYLEWFSYEFYSIQAANLSQIKQDDELLAAHVSISNSCSFYSMISLGISVAITTYVGNAVGQNKIGKAYRLSIIGLAIALVIGFLACIFLSNFKEQWASYFSEDLIVKAKLLDFEYLFMIIMILDILQYAFLGIMRAIGKQNIANLSYFACSYLIGQPLSYFLAFHTELSLQGIWIGYIIGLFILVIIFAITLKCSNWRKQIYDIQARLELENTSLRENDKQIGLQQDLIQGN